MDIINELQAYISELESLPDYDNNPLIENIENKIEELLEAMEVYENSL